MSARSINQTCPYMTSEKQQIANEQNGQLGGVKTDAGKEISKYNAVKHGILQQIATDYEQELNTEIVAQLEEEFAPQGLTERLLIERIAVHYLRLFRIGKAENEYMRSRLDPRIVEEKGFMDFSLTTEVVKSEGYKPLIDQASVGDLTDIYSRYETTIENRLYKALRELQQLQATRNGTAITNHVALDIDVTRKD